MDHGGFQHGGIPGDHPREPAGHPPDGHRHGRRERHQPDPESKQDLSADGLHHHLRVRRFQLCPGSHLAERRGLPAQARARDGAFGSAFQSDRRDSAPEEHAAPDHTKRHPGRKNQQQNAPGKSVFLPERGEGQARFLRGAPVPGERGVFSGGHPPREPAGNAAGAAGGLQRIGQPAAPLRDPEYHRRDDGGMVPSAEPVQHARPPDHHRDGGGGGKRTGGGEAPAHVSSDPRRGKPQAGGFPLHRRLAAGAQADECPDRAGAAGS